jgi:hypothetical protein
MVDLLIIGSWYMNGVKCGENLKRRKIKEEKNPDFQF